MKAPPRPYVMLFTLLNAISYPVAVLVMDYLNPTGEGRKDFWKTLDEDEGHGLYFWSFQILAIFINGLLFFQSYMFLSFGEFDA